MTTHLAIDDDLINEALTLGHFKTKEDTVVTALREFINRCKQSYLLPSSREHVALFETFCVD